MTTSLPPRPRRIVLALLLAGVAAPALAQPIEAGSQDALDLPGTRHYGTPAGRDSAAPFPARRQFSDQAGNGAASPDLPATLPQRQSGGVQVPYGAYGENGYAGPVDGDGRSGYAGRDGYGGAGGYGGGEWEGSGDREGGTPYGGGEFGAGGPAVVAPFGGGPGTPGPQFSSQLPAYQGRSRR